MPTVPRLQNPVQESALPNVQVGVEAPLAAFGGGDAAAGATKATNDFLQTSIDFASEYKDQADKARFEEAVINETNIKNNLFWNVDTGAFNRKESAALGIQEEYGASYDDYVSKIEKGLSNDRQKNQFRAYVAKSKSDFNNNLMKHSFQEGEKYKDSIYKNGVQTAQNNAVLNWNNLTEVDKSVIKANQLITENLTSKGVPSDEIDATRAKVTGDIYAQVINRMIDHGDDQAASKLYNDLKNEMKRQSEAIGPRTLFLDDQSVMMIEKNLELSSTRGGAQRISDAMIAKHPNDIGAAFKEADKIAGDNVKLREASRDKIKQSYSDMEAAKNFRQDKIKDQAYSIITKTGSADKVPPSMFNSLDPEQQTALKKYAQSVASGDFIPNNYAVSTQLENMAADSPEEFLKIDLFTKHRQELDNQHFDRLVGLRSSLLKKDEKAIEELRGYRSATTVVDEALKEVGVTETKKPKDYSKIRSDIEIDYKEFVSKHKRKPDNQELKKITDLHVLNTINPKKIDSWFRGEKPAYKRKAGEEFIYVPNADQEAKIKEVLKKSNLPTTEKAVVDYYNWWLKNGSK